MIPSSLEAYKHEGHLSLQTTHIPMPGSKTNKKLKNLTKTIVEILKTYKLINEEKVKSRRVKDFPKQCPKQAKLRSKTC